MPRYAIKGTLYAHLLGVGLAGVLMLLFPAGIMPPVPVLPAWNALIVSTVIGTSIAMFGAKWGAQWRNRRDRIMRLAR